MLVKLFFFGLFLSVQAVPAHFPGHIHDHDHVIPAHHVAPVTHARLVSETVETRNEAELPASTTGTVSIPAEADDGFSAAFNADASVVSETPATSEVTEVRNEQTEVIPQAQQLPAPVQETIVREELPQQQQIVHSEQLPMEQQMIHQEVIRDGILPLMSSFPCEGHSRGYFGDEMTDCKIFVQCNPNMDPHGFPFMERFVFQCPVETRWDQRLLTCVRTEEALPCQSSRLYWADTEMRFAAFQDLPMQQVIPIPDGAIKAPIVQTQFVKQAPVVQTQFVEQAPVVQTQFVEQEPIVQTQFVKQEPIVQTQFVKQAPVVQTQFVEQAPVVQTQFVKQEPIVKTQLVKQEPIVQTQFVKQAPMVRTQFVKQAPMVRKNFVKLVPIVRTQFVKQAPIVRTQFVKQAPIVRTQFVKQAPLPVSPAMVMRGHHQNLQIRRTGIKSVN